jgi:hypothetical protein
MGSATKTPQGIYERATAHAAKKSNTYLEKGQISADAGFDWFPVRNPVHKGSRLLSGC